MFIRNAVGEAVRAGEDKEKKKVCFRQIERDVRSLGAQPRSRSHS